MAKLSTTPSAQTQVASSVHRHHSSCNSKPAPPAVLLGLLPGVLPPAKASHSSNSSTRATSPSSSVTSSDEMRKQSATGGSDAGALARRRGRSVLMLSELVVDFDVEKTGRSPSDDSSLGAAGGNSSRCTNSTRCTPCTPQMMSFSPQKGKGRSSHAGSTKMASETLSTSSTPASELSPAALANQVARAGVMCTSPMQRSTDASQRSPAIASGLGGAAAGGDASRRQPVGRMSLGVAVIGGDASQRSPPGSTVPPRMPDFTTVSDASHRSPPGSTVPPRMPESSIARMSKPPMPRPPATPQNSAWNVVLKATCPASAPDASQRRPAGNVHQDASQRIPAGSVKEDSSKRSPTGNMGTTMTVDSCSHVLQSLLSGPCGDGSAISGNDLAERLRAAAPESYED